VTGLLVFALAWHGGRHLKNGDAASGDKVNAVLDMAVLFGALTLLTGIIFSKVQWGAYWQWDPRQASFLLLWLILAAGLALRSAFTDEARQMSVMSGYALAIVIPAIFLMFVYPRLPWVISFHPKAASLGWDYRAGVYGAVLVFGAAAHLLATRRAQVAALIRRSKEDTYDNRKTLMTTTLWIAAIPMAIVWCGLWLYHITTERSLRAASKDESASR